MAPILEVVDKKLAHLREINVNELQLTLIRLDEEMRRLNDEMKSHDAKRSIINREKSEISQQIFDCRLTLSHYEHYLPVMSYAVEKARLGYELVDILRLLDVSTQLSMEARVALRDFSDSLSTFLTTGEDSILVFQEIRELMLGHRLYWSCILRRIDSSAELLSFEAKLFLHPIVEKLGVVNAFRFEEKTEDSGKYFGIIAIFSYQPHGTSETVREISFFVKGHQNFEIESNKREYTTRDPKPPDMKEILVYKILEHIRYGPKAHYFINPMARHGLFIATQDCAFTKSPHLKTKHFLTAGIIKGSLAPHTERDAIDLTVLDIVTRCLVLKDLHMKNYGRVISTLNDECDSFVKWKLLDFLVLPAKDFQNYDSRLVIGDRFLRIVDHPDPRFTSDGGVAGSILRSEYMASHRSVIVNSAIGVLEGKIRRGRGTLKIDFGQAVWTSFDEITNFTRGQGESLGIDVGVALDDLDKYCHAICENYCALKETIQLLLVSTSEVLKV